MHSAVTSPTTTEMAQHMATMRLAGLPSGSVGDCVGVSVGACVGAAVGRVGAAVGASVGSVLGIAVGLGAQDLFKNLISGLLIISEKRFIPGEWIQVDGVVEGTVEKINFRSTLVRRFDKSPVFVPNSALSDAAVTNFSRMTHRRIKWAIGVRYDTTSEQLREIRDKVLAAMRDAYEARLAQVHEGAREAAAAHRKAMRAVQELRRHGAAAGGARAPEMHAPTMASTRHGERIVSHVSVAAERQTAFTVLTKMAVQLSPFGPLNGSQSAGLYDGSE